MRRMTLYILLGIIVSITIAGIAFLHQPNFGRLPKGERLERIKRSPNYREGVFRNIDTTILMTSHKSRLSGIWSFLFRKVEGLRPDEPIPAIKTDLRKIPLEENTLVWFGHSSYLLQVDEKRILVDPVFCMASPVSFVNKPFRGTEIYSPDDMPDIDYLVISHDHWDHLDYHTVKQLKGRIGKVVCPLGVGEHFEHWGFDKSRIIELDWKESATLSQQFIIHCLPPVRNPTANPSKAPAIRATKHKVNNTNVQGEGRSIPSIFCFSDIHKQPVVPGLSPGCHPV